MQFTLVVFVLVLHDILNSIELEIPTQFLIYCSKREWVVIRHCEFSVPSVRIQTRTASVSMGINMSFPVTADSRFRVRSSSWSNAVPQEVNGATRWFGLCTTSAHASITTPKPGLKTSLYS